MKIDGIGGIGPAAGIAAPRIGTNSGPEFGRVLESAIGGVEGARASAETQVARFLNGEGGELHTAVLATQKAELAFELFLQVRNKAVQAYQEIMRMQV